ncbi:hypothetical protein EVAR_86556_1 [Eumeta japonica]|uniref:Uncharacterized protein n=1 Tax=Eumeta variegata TaxID=151549 RepID=A0A4C1ZKR8_EUMVA|nr:hypothetical protein EVAR_86556_1 [Eumeta japonica]
MEAMSSAMKTMRDKEPDTANAGKESRRELAEAHKSSQIPNLIRRSGCEITNRPDHVDSAKVERVRKPGTKGDTEMQHERDMEAIQNKMRSRKEIKVEAAKAANPAHHEGVMAYHKDADIVENVLAQNKHLVKDINLRSDDTGQI